MKKFKKGTRVRVIDGDAKGHRGYVCEEADEGDISTGVRLDDYSSLTYPMHDCSGNCEYGYGWYVLNEYLALDKKGTIQEFYEKIEGRG